MKTLFKTLGGLLLLSVVLAVVALGLLLYNANVYTGVIQWAAQRFAGYDVAIDDIEVNVSPAELIVKNVLAAPVDPAAKPGDKRPLPPLQVQHAKLGVDLLKAVKRTAPFWSAQAQGVKLDAKRMIKASVRESAEDDSGNEALDLRKLLTFEHILLDDVTIKQDSGEQTREIVLARLEAKSVAQNGVELSANGAIAEEAFSVDGRADVQENNVVNVDAKLIGVGVNANIKGKAGVLGLVDPDFKLEMSIDSLTKAEALLDTKLPELAPLTIAATVAQNDEGKLELKANGSLQDKPVALNALFDRAALEQENPVFEGSAQWEGFDTTLAANGRVMLADVMHPELDLEVSAPSLEAIEKTFNRKLPELAPLELSATISQDDANVTRLDAKGLVGGKDVVIGGTLAVNEAGNAERQMIKLDLTGSGLGVDASVIASGDVSKTQLTNFENAVAFVRDLRSADINLTLKADSLAQLEKSSGLKLPALAPLDVVIDAKQTDEQSVRLNAAGSISKQEVKLHAELDKEGLLSEATVLDGSLNWAGLGAKLDAKGKVHLNDIQRPELALTASAKSFKTIEEIFSTKLPAIAPLDIDATVSAAENNRTRIDAKGSLAGNNVDVSGTMKIVDGAKTPKEQVVELDLKALGLGIEASVVGQVSPYNLTFASDARVNAKAESLSQLEKLIDTPLEKYAPLDASFHAVAKDGAIALNDLNAKVGDNSLTGTVDYDPAKPFINVALSGDRLNLNPFLPPVKEAATQTKSAQKTQAAKSLDLKWITTLNGKVALDINELTARRHRVRDALVDATINNGRIQVNTVSGAYTAVSDKQEPAFEAVPFKLSGLIETKTQTQDDAPPAFQVDLAANVGDASAKIRGPVKLSAESQESLNIEVEADSLQSLSELAGRNLEAFQPLSFSAKAKLDGETLNLNPVTLEVAGNDLNGQLNVDWSTAVTAIDGSLSGRVLDIDSLRIIPVPDADNNDNKNSKKKDKAKKSGKVFSEQPLNWRWLDSFATDMTLDIKKFVLNQTTLRNVTGQVVLKDGVLQADPIDANLSQGGFRGSLNVVKHPDGKGANVKLNLSAKNLSPADLGQRGEGVIDGGFTNIDINLTASGGSPHALASTLGGELIVQIQQATILNKYLELVGSDLFMQILSTLNPFVKKDPETQLDCGIARFVAENGVLTSPRQIAIETNKMKIIGGGEVNLQSEQLELGFTPIAQKGLGISLSNLVKFLRVGGSLRKPTPEIDPAGILKSGATIGAAVSTGGLSLLAESLFKRVKNAKSACETIFEEEAEVPDAIDGEKKNKPARK